MFMVMFKVLVIVLVIVRSMGKVMVGLLVIVLVIVMSMVGLLVKVLVIVMSMVGLLVKVLVNFKVRFKVFIMGGVVEMNLAISTLLLGRDEDGRANF